MTTHKGDKGPLRTQKDANVRSNDTCAAVNSGVCGFTCRIRAWKIDKTTVGLEVSESGCEQIQGFSEHLSPLSLKEIFMPITRNPVYLAAEQSRCHPSCPIPAAVLKAAEVAMEMALARDASIRFETCKGEEV